MDVKAMEMGLLGGLDADRILRAWLEGGWVMVPLFLVALTCYAAAVRVLRYLAVLGHDRWTDAQLADWIRRPDQRQGEVGVILDYVLDEGKDAAEDIRRRFQEVRMAKVPEVDRRLVFIQVLVAAAPLLGLLGTVLGMLKTFRGIALGGGKMVDAIAKGISEALITTEMGLLIALPGMALAYWVRRKRNDYVGFLTRLESLTLQREVRTGATHPIRTDIP